MKVVTQRQARQLLHNKFVVVLGGSVQRSMYKDLVLLLQKDKYLTSAQLKTKGEVCFEDDCLVEGGTLGPMTNGTEYREVRQYRSDHHLVRFYFLTRIYSPYMESILSDLRHGLKPDVILVSSCIWDVSRYGPSWTRSYRENLQRFFEQIKSAVPAECLILWNLAMPLGPEPVGGFLLPEMAYMGPTLRYDVIDANFYSGTLADAYGLDVLDLHFLFRLSLKNRAKDGIHWDAEAHRRITSLFLHHTATAWGVALEPGARGGPLWGGYRSLCPGGRGGGVGGNWMNGVDGRGRYCRKQFIDGWSGYGEEGLPSRGPNRPTGARTRPLYSSRGSRFPRPPPTAPPHLRAPPILQEGPTHFYRQQEWSNGNCFGPCYPSNCPPLTPDPHCGLQQPYPFTGCPGQENGYGRGFTRRPPFDPRTSRSYGPPSSWPEEPHVMRRWNNGPQNHARFHPYHTHTPRIRPRHPACNW